jgi:diguanylate cyclase (GGDEF)-like protein
MNETLLDEMELAQEIQRLLTDRSEAHVTNRGLSEKDDWSSLHLAEITILKTSEYESLAEMQEVYERTVHPAICFASLEEAPHVAQWLRSTDDIAIIGEAESLTQWRINRIANAIKLKFDPLTKTFSRKELLDVLAPLCRNATEVDPVSLILFDVDNLKTINNEFGNSAGDQLLTVIAEQVKSLCGGTMVARTRGGEFGIVVRDREPVAKRVADIVHSQINLPSMRCFDSFGGAEISASFGIASTHTRCQPNYLLSRADEAVFSAKANGRNQVVCFSEITAISNRNSDELDVVSMENKARVLSERVTNFVTQQSKRIVSTLRKEANTDVLTQLSNRRCLDKILESEFAKALETGNELCVALIDLDHFGKVNKDHGWPTGDKILREVSAAIEDGIRSADFVGRYGGEEICLVMPSTSIVSAAQVCERIRQNVSATQFTTTSDKQLSVTLSTGVIELDHQVDETVGQLMEKVSLLTLEAKEGGRNRVVSLGSPAQKGGQT